MLLKEILGLIKDARIVGERNVDIKHLTEDSRECKNGSCFFATIGERVDSHIYTKEAEKLGAVLIVGEKETNVNIPQLIVEDSRYAMGIIAEKFYCEPMKKLKIIGITGTNGKTTTSYMLSAILKRAGKVVGIIGTLGIFYGKKKIPPELTTPNPIFLHEIFMDMVKNNVEYVVMEVSAHALYYKKDSGIEFEIGIFTNLSQDHLDFFHTMKSYKQAKEMMFRKGKCKIAVLNGDELEGKEIGKIREKDGEKNYYYGLDSTLDSVAVITNASVEGSEFMTNLSDLLFKVSLSLIGKHNVYNALASISAAYLLGIEKEDIIIGLKELKGVIGRLERICKFHGADIFVDFAHTPDGLEKTLITLKEFCKGRLICAFGCGGNRDRLKRPLMGETVARIVDFGIITSDNPRDEEPTEIIREIEAGYSRFSDKYVAIEERREATRYALGILKKGDILVIAGKGGEVTQEIMGIKYEYNDQFVVKEEIQKLDGV